MICASCKRDNAPNLSYCDYCGTPLGPTSAPAAKRRTEMESPASGDGKRMTEFEASPAPAAPAAPDPFDPFKPVAEARPARAPAAAAPAPAAAPARKAATRFDGGARDPFAPAGVGAPGAAGAAPGAAAAAPGPAPDRYAGRRIVGWLVTFDRHPDGMAFTLREGRNLLGRDAERCDIVIDDDDLVSNGHAVIVWRNGTARIADDKSQNGTFLNEDDVLQPEQIRDGDVVRVGQTRMICRLLDHERVSSLWKPAAG